MSFLKRGITNSKKKIKGGKSRGGGGRVLELEPGGSSLNPEFVTPNCNS